MLTCEACERAAAVVAEPTEEPNEPFRVCKECHARLIARALRPLECFNLAKRHSRWPYLLHDDFYDEDGRAYAADIEVVEAERHAAPSLAEVSTDCGRLLDYSITRWQLSDDVARAWQQFASRDILPALTSRYASTPNVGIRARVMEIVAEAVGADGADFVSYAWDDYPNGIDLSSLARASARCLDSGDGIRRVLAAISELDGRATYEMMGSLSYFESPLALDWIEEHLFEPIGDRWGYLAAASQFDWSRAMRWLEHGRPLSLIALDTLASIVRPSTPLLQKLQPRLYEPPTEDAFRKMLSAYGNRDPVPRVERRVEFLLAEAHSLTSGE